MPLQQTSTGIQIQGIAEIKSQIEEAYRQLFGVDVSLGPDSVFGKEIGIYSEREALLQAQMQFIQAGFSRLTAQGASLDSISNLTGSDRQGASQSRSSAGRCTGTDTTIVLNGSTVIQQNVGLDVWTVVDGTDGISPFGYEIGTDVSGEVADVIIQSVETGDKVFASSSQFTIGTPIAGWDEFLVDGDIETFETGRDVEPDGEFRDRGRDELFAGGNDLSGIKAVVTKVPGVTEVQVFDNPSITTTDSDGIEPSHVEVIVTGGSDLDVATAILLRVPPGTSLQGTTELIMADVEGNPIPIRFTRPAMIPITVFVTISNLNAEGTLPENFASVAEAAVLEFGNANARVSQDVLYQQFIGPVADAIKDTFTGKYAYDFIDSEIGLTSSTANSNISIGIRERADFDSSRIVVDLDT